MAKEQLLVPDYILCGLRFCVTSLLGKMRKKKKAVAKFATAPFSALAKGIAGQARNDGVRV